jgi:hypothetical protein
MQISEVNPNSPHASPIAHPSYILMIYKDKIMNYLFILLLLFLLLILFLLLGCHSVK